MDFTYYQSLLIEIRQRMQQTGDWRFCNFLENHADALYSGENVGEMK